MNYRILIAEDETRLRSVLCDWFRSRGDDPQPAKDGTEALALAQENEYDAVLLDIMMPGLDGRAVCRAVRKGSDVPIIFLTALSDEEDKLAGYELGADDYVTKPFSMAVLYAKVEALIRRRRGSLMSGDELSAGPITMRLSSRQVFVSGREVALSPKEFDLLECLMKNKNLVLSREQLLIKCWGYDFEGEARAVDTQIKRLREKLGEAAGCIKTVIKSGYKLEG
ncbi:MAG: response regulator transcription factor [Lachnospiraceae bacterium]|nr:response regulator transcription factor [Lachnospiraceae bacterium]